MLRHYRIASCLLVAAACASAGGCRREVVSAAEPKPPKVTVAHPTFRQVQEEDSYNGWLRASAEVEVRARVRGHIQKVCFHDGDLVKADQLLFELDSRPFDAQIAQGLAQAKAIEAQKISLEKDVARYTELVKTKAVTQQTLDKAEADVAAAAAQEVAKMEDVKGRQLDLEYSRITAPIAGKIGRAMLTEGNLVNAGGSDPILTTIVAINPMDIYFSVDERAAQRFQKSIESVSAAPKGDAGPKSEAAPKANATDSGKAAKEPTAAAPELRDRRIAIRFGLETDTGFPYTATIDFADNKVDSTTGTIAVRATTDNSKGLLVSGSRVRIRVPVGQPADANLVPDSAINTDLDRKYLLMVDAKNIVGRRDVELGRLQDDGMRVILSAKPPLQKTDSIIVEGLQRAR